MTDKAVDEAVERVKERFEQLAERDRSEFRK